VTSYVSVKATAFEMQRALELLPSIGEVAVSIVDNANGGRNWTVTFLNNLGDLPRMTVTRGRLNGTNPLLYVVEDQAGTPTKLVYDGIGEPSVREFTATGLTPGQTYAFKVAALSSAHPEGGMGLPSLASTTVVARSGADAAHTTAQGSATTKASSSRCSTSRCLRRPRRAATSR
jgi:hypothetical protein